MFISLNLWWFSVTAGNLKREKKEKMVPSGKFTVVSCFKISPLCSCFLLFFMCTDMLRDQRLRRIQSDVIDAFLKCKKNGLMYMYIYIAYVLGTFCLLLTKAQVFLGIIVLQFGGTLLQLVILGQNFWVFWGGTFLDPFLFLTSFVWIKGLTGLKFAPDVSV